MVTPPGNLTRTAVGGAASGLLGVAGRARFLGAVERAELPRLYASVDLLVATSHASETFGIALQPVRPAQAAPGDPHASGGPLPATVTLFRRAHACPARASGAQRLRTCMATWGASQPVTPAQAGVHPPTRDYQPSTIIFCSKKSPPEASAVHQSRPAERLKSPYQFFPKY